MSTLEAKALELDASLARAELGWNPLWTQEEAVRSTINWWKKILHESKSPMQACLDDLKIVLDG
jgi:dTDP-D-glucose 4,6-dehydratase